MGELHHIAFEDEAGNIKDKVESYWTKRADSFFELRHDEIESEKSAKWLEEIKQLLPAGKSLNILDLGCGTGYFEVILGREGHKVTGIDLTEEMITKANEMIRIYGLDPNDVKAMVGDAENVAFADESFDVVITRNLTWTLPHPIDAYKDWYRVLRKGGVLLNFDAEYAKGAHNLNSPENIAHKNVSKELADECHNIYHMLTISTLDRPEWDVHILEEIGFKDIITDKTFGDRIFVERDEFYIPDKMFSIKAIK
ncbi:Methyltransferase domain-containing protein [Pseudobutyrivibrio sp. OR37]|uniref:class I SAM-dependent methyltransferase n=1 Tax=Pseudobutyrivibrio sp. OR37 TaxID=1798186 RepID=UPI0008F22368|nr:class I SAM-dependent methyltransferase [Pseudobutyrivibrio sp. OR37]SFH66739.1 Methyltransferase domain-containing protein [Pseudobutyrivibrio sp. OR37]